MLENSDITRMRNLVGAGLDADDIVNRGEDGRRVTDVDQGQVTLYGEDEVKAFDNYIAQKNTSEQPEETADNSRVGELQDISQALDDSGENVSKATDNLFSRVNAYKKFRFNQEETLLEAKNISQATGIPENIILSNADSFANAKEIFEAQQKNVDFTQVFKENPALAKLAVNGNDTMAAIAMHHIPEIQEQKSIIQNFVDGLRRAELQKELTHIGDMERSGGARIDKNRVKEIYKELESLKAPGITEDFLGAVVGGTAEQLPQMGRGAYQAAYRGLQGAIVGGGYGAIVGGGIASGVTATGAALTMGSMAARYGWFEQSYNEMAGSNYVALRMMKDKNGNAIYTPEQANNIAVAQAAVSAGIESFNVGKILGRMGNAKGIFAKDIKNILTKASSKEAGFAALGQWLKHQSINAGKTVLEESSEEAAQSVSDNLIQNVGSYVYNKDNYVGAGEMVKDAAENFIAAVPSSLGFGIAGAMGAATSGSVRRMARALQIENEYKFSETKTGQGIQLLNALKQHIANSELFKKDPETAKAVLKENLTDTGFDNVYIDTAEMRQAGQTELLTQVVNSLDLSEETKQNIIAGNEELNAPVTLYQLATADIDEKLNEYISFDANAMSFAKNKRFAETIRDEMKVLREQGQQEEKAITDIILDNAFSSEDREAAAQYLQDVGLRNASRQLNTDLKAVNAQIDAMIKAYMPDYHPILIDEGNTSYRYSNKGYGYFTDSEGNYIPEGAIGGDVQGEIKSGKWTWNKVARKINQEWIERSGANTAEARRQVVSDALLGNNPYDIFGGPVNAEIQQDLNAFAALQEEKARLEKLQNGFSNIANNEDIIARGLSKEGYQVYKNVMEQLKNASTAEAREAAQFNAILLARHADRYAAIVREFTNNKEYTALDYMQNVGIEANATDVKEGGLNQLSGLTEAQWLKLSPDDKLAVDMQDWAHVLDNFSTLNATARYKVMHAPLVLKLVENSLTAPINNELKINANYSILQKFAAVGGKHYLDIPPKEWKKLPEKIADPLMILKNRDNRNGKDILLPNEVIFFVDLQNSKGENVIVPVTFNKANDKQYSMKTGFAKQMGSANFSWLDKRVLMGDLLYINKEKTGISTQPAAHQWRIGLSISKSFLNSIPDETNLRNLKNDINNIFYQDVRGQITFDDNKSVISLLQTADQSTFAHEMGHLFLRDLEQLAKMEGCPEQIKKDWETVKKWTEWHDGALDEYKGTTLYGTYDDKGKFVPGEFNILNAAIKKAVAEGNTAEVEHLKFKWAQERWARGWEEYLRQGKAPTSGLRQVFRSFKQWLCGIYKDFLQVGGAPSPEVKAVMDRMIASQEEIEIEAKRSAHNSFVRAGGLNFLADTNQEMFEKYWAQAQEEAAEEVLKQAMKDVQDDYTKQRQEYLDSVRADAEAESYDNPVFLIQEEVAEAEDKENTLAGLLQMAQMTNEEYEAEIKKYNGSREGYINARVAEEAKMFDENPLAAENIKANAQDAINRGEYSDLLNEFELAAMIQKGQIEQRIGKMADKKFAEIEKALSGIDAREGTVEKISALQQRINDLLYTIRWNDAEKKMLMDLQEAAAQAKLEAEVLSHKADVKELKSKLQDIRKELKHSEKEKEYNLRWAEAEKNILLDMQKAEDEARRKADVAEAKAKTKAETEAKMQAKMDAQKEKLKHKVDEAEYNARWREAELNFIIDEFKGKLQDKIEDFNQYRKETRTGLKVVRDANKGLMKRFREYVKEDNKSLPLEESANERYWRRKAEEASREMYASLKNEEYEQAAYYKQVELINNIRATEARKNQKLMDKVETRLKQKLKTLNKNTHLSANQAYLYRNMMRTFGFDSETYELDVPPQWEGVESLLEEMRDTGYSFTDFETGNDSIPVWLYEAMNGKEQSGGINKMTAPELRDLYRFMTALYRSGSAQKIKDRLGRLESVDVVAQNIANEMSERLYTITDGKPKVNQEVTFVQKFVRGLRATHQNALNMDTICRMLGPEAESYIYNRINDAANNRLEIQKAMVLKLKDLFGVSLNNSKDFLNKQFRFNDELITGKQVIALALNWGNETNRMRVRDGFNVTDQQVEELLANMSDNEWKFVQGVWDLFNELWPQVRDVQFRRTGSAARTEQALAFTIKDNIGKIHDIKGGYYPISYDRNQSFKVTQMLTDSAARTAVGSSAQLGSKMNSTKERKKKVTGMPLSTNLNDIAVKLEDQINIIAMKEAVDDVNVLFRNEKFRNAVVNTFGVDMMSRMNQWLGQQWNHSSLPKNTLESLAARFRGNLTLSVLGARLSTIVTNFANMFGVMHYIGPVGFMASLRSFYNDPKGNYNFIVENSVFIRERISTKDRDIRNTVSSGANLDTGVMATVKEYNEKMKELSFVPIMLTDFMFALPLWQSEYERACREADITKLDAEQIHQEGVRAGDAAVRRIFGSGQEQDLNEWQKGNEFTKIFTMYYSYFAVIYNAMAYSVFEGRKNYKQTGDWKKAVAPVASAGFYMIIAQSIMDAAVREAFDLLGDDDDPYERIKKKSKENIVDNGVGGIPFVRQAIPYLIATATGERYSLPNIPLAYYLQQAGKVMRNAADDKKDAYDLARAGVKLFGQTTGISQTALDAIPNTIEYINEADKYSLWDYIKSTGRDKRLGK